MFIPRRVGELETTSATLPDEPLARLGALRGLALGDVVGVARLGGNREAGAVRSGRRASRPDPRGACRTGWRRAAPRPRTSRRGCRRRSRCRRSVVAAGRPQVARRGADRVDRVVGILAVVSVGVHPVRLPGRGEELHPADRPGGRDVEVGAEGGLDPVDRRPAPPRGSRTGCRRPGRSSSRKGGIANWSMRKLGTPIGAGPKSAIVRVGLAFVGTPSGARVGGSEGLRPSSEAFEPPSPLPAPPALPGRPIRRDRPVRLRRRRPRSRRLRRRRHRRRPPPPPPPPPPPCRRQGAGAGEEARGPARRHRTARSSRDRRRRSGRRRHRPWRSSRLAGSGGGGFVLEAAAVARRLLDDLAVDDRGGDGSPEDRERNGE